MEAADTAPEARRFGKYTLVAKLATGGMAEIFLARLHGDGGFEKLVCIKRILPHLARDPQFVAMFLDEARVAARISHPNVCQVFELGEWQGQYYIAMEYLEGVPLSVFRRKDFYPLLPDPRLIAGFGVQACEGLHHAHQLKRADGELLGVVHRDISPQNLFATTDGIVKVLDFGIAKVQDATVRTSTGAVKGTYAYMAPEQLRNEPVDRRTDVWAIGVVLWESLAQRHLFKRDTEFLTFEAITKLPIPAVVEVRPDVPALLSDTITRALSRNPDDRFSSARALGEALAQAVGPLGGPLSPAGISDEVSRSFEATLAEQRMLLRIAREGGHFDLDRSSALVAHGTAISTTPVSNIQRRVEAAQAEVAHFVAATQAIESLEADQSGVGAMKRRTTDGAFTPAPSRRAHHDEQMMRRSSSYDAAAPYDYDMRGAPADDDFGERRYSQTHEAVGRRSQSFDAQYDAPVDRRSMPYEAQRRSQSYAVPDRRSQLHVAQRQSGPYSVAPPEWQPRYDDTEPPVVPRTPLPQAPARSSKLPWLIALIAVVAAGGTAAMLYLELRSIKSASPSEATTESIVMKSEPTTGVDLGQHAAPAKDQPVLPASDTPTPADAEKADQADKQSDDQRDNADGKSESSDKATRNDKSERTRIERDKRDRSTKHEKAAKTDKTDNSDKPDKVVKVDNTDTKPDDAKAKPDKLVEKAVAGPPGFITIDSTPVYAVIYIDNKKYGETPLVNIKLAPGKHTVRAVSPSGSTRTLTINIESGKTAPVRRIEW